jgi:TetR/AcrR family transcriptional regulator
MPKIDHDTKQRILEAAEQVFHRHGFKGTRTTLIAEQAGISRTMLHYYFSTKEALFEAVLAHTFGSVIGHLKRLVNPGNELASVIAHLIHVVSDLLEEKPHLASFIVNIMNESPELFAFMQATNEDNLPRLLDELLAAGKTRGEVSPELTGEDLMLNIYAICAMPYLGAPYIKARENRDDAAMQAFNQQRRAKNLHFVLQGIRP